LLSLKSPEIEMCEMVRVACPVLVIVTAIAELLWPTIVSGKDRVVGLSVATGVAPWPDSGITCGLPRELSVIVIAPLAGFAFWGVKVTE
jgi:hypothetical protein